MIDTDVHQQLRAFLRSRGELPWLHHLTMARLVARSLRVKRTAIVQVGSAAGTCRHRLSYLTPVLLAPESVVIVAMPDVQQRLIHIELPRLRQWLDGRPHAQRPIIQCQDRSTLPNLHNTDALVLTSPSQWLDSALSDHCPFRGITTIIDGADDLEHWARQILTVEIQPSHWQGLMLAYPDAADTIRDTRVALTHRVLRHPPSPYECWSLDSQERQWLQGLLDDLDSIGALGDRALPHWQQLASTLATPNHPVLVHLDRRMGQFHLSCSPLHLADHLAPLWQSQTTLFIGSCLDGDAQASIFQQRVGLDRLQNLDLSDGSCESSNSLGDSEDSGNSGNVQRGKLSPAPDMPHPTLTCLKFSPDRQQESIQLYLPDRLPLPNTPQYQQALLHHIHQLLSRYDAPDNDAQGAQEERGIVGTTVNLVSDLPLKNQLATRLAANFGSRVRVEETGLDDNGILVCTWEFWRSHQQQLPVPKLLVMAALPIPAVS
ncbi:MAG: hypothetical protein ACFCBU_08895, partial [Cyanophyceae cyanobacterium]